MMEKLSLHRVSQTPDETFGVLIRNDVPLCLTLEDPWKNNERNVSCIPAGRYQCAPHNGSRYKNVWILENVPGRSAILIHQGNTNDDTQGCILVGQKFGTLDEKNAVLHSRIALEKLKRELPDHFQLEIVNLH